MSDYNSSLPVRTENAGDIASKIVDANIPSQGLTVNLDGSVNVTDNGGSLTVDANNLDIRDLAFASDKVDVSGSLVTVSATDLDIRDLAFASDKVDVSGSSITATVSATNLDIRDLVFATDKVDVSGSSITVSSTDLDIRNLVAATDSVSAYLKDGAGTAITSTTSGSKQALDVSLKDQSGNPLGTATYPLTVSLSPNGGGNEINDYLQSAAVAVSATANHDYTVTAGKVFYLTQVEASGSGKAKMEIKVETGVGTGIFDTKFVQFNSTAETNMSVQLKSVITVVAGVKVRIVMQNRDNQPQDLYSTICGVEVTP